MLIPDRPKIYQINTATFLNRLSSESGKTIDFSNVPAEAWDKISALTMDAVWLMGVWERSPAGLPFGKQNPELKQALPDLKDKDVLGSAYSIKSYNLDNRFGGNAGLAKAREELKKRGLALILDYVPNHVALDHPWTAESPECFIQGSDEEAVSNPGSFFKVDQKVYAKGKDPNFEPWSDVLQLNAFSPVLREQTIATLSNIAEMCDGVRCDMAMLLVNKIFAKTWGKRAGRKPKQEFWPEVIGAVRKAHPGFMFMAEVYWGMESELVEQGFDYCYDKLLYDFLVEDEVAALQKYLGQDAAFQKHLVRFIENHDEPRAVTAFPPPKDRAAAVAVATGEGAQLYHDGQFEGFKVRVPVQLGRAPKEAIDQEQQAFYNHLLHCVSESGMRKGKWGLVDTGSSAVVAWSWIAERANHLVLINLSGQASKADVKWDIGRLKDILSGSELSVTEGSLRVELEPWQYYILESKG